MKINLRLNKRFLVFIFGVFSISISAFGKCVVSLDPVSISTSTCPALGVGLPADNLDELKKSLTDLYNSSIVQANNQYCAKLGDLVEAICQPSKPISTYYTNTTDSKIKNISISKSSNDARILNSLGKYFSPKNTASYPTQMNYFPIYKYCSTYGKRAISLSPECNAIIRCGDPIFEKSFNGYIPTANYMYAYPISGTCNSTLKSITYDSSYLMIKPFRENIRTESRAPFCDSTATMCLNYNIPLLNQSSSDLLTTITKKTRIRNAADVGFCAPTSIAMMEIGLKNLSQGTFGSVIDSGSTYIDPSDSISSANWSGVTYRTGQLMGTDWWVGGTSTADISNNLKKNLGEATGTLNSIMGTSNDYSNSNFINFTNKFGGMSQLSLTYDSTTSNFVYHSLVLAGYTGGHLRMFDPWGRLYLVDVSTQPRSAKFLRVNSKLFTYATDATNTKFIIPTPGYTYSITSSSPITLNQLIPLRSFSSTWSEAAINYEISIGVFTLVEKTGTPVPTVQHISGDQGFVYLGPSSQAQLLPETENAVINPGPGLYFEAAENQYVADVLFGIGQRIRGLTYNVLGRAPTDAQYNKAYTLQSSSSLGSFDASYISALSSEPITNLKYSLPDYTYRPLESLVKNIPSNEGGKILSYTVSPTLPSGLSLNSVTGEISGSPQVSLVRTQFQITAKNNSGSFNAYIYITVLEFPPKTISYDFSKFGSLIAPNNMIYFGASYSLLPVIDGGKVSTFSITPSLPSGMIFDTATGKISGSPTRDTPSISYLIRATNVSGSAMTTFTFGVLKDMRPPSGMTYPATSTLMVNKAPGQVIGSCIFQFGFTSLQNGSPVNTYSVSPVLPDGLYIDSTLGHVCGIPKVAKGPMQYTVTATNIYGKTTATFNMQVAINPAGSPTPLVSLKYSSPTINLIRDDFASITPTVVGGAAAIYYSEPQLPAGMYIESTGFIKGYFNGLSNSSGYKITAVNALGSVSTNVSLVSVSPSPFSGVRYPLIRYLVGADVKFAPTFSSGTASCFFIAAPDVATKLINDALVSAKEKGTSKSPCALNPTYTLPPGVNFDMTTGVFSGKISSPFAPVTVNVNIWNGIFQMAIPVTLQ